MDWAPVVPVLMRSPQAVVRLAIAMSRRMESRFLRRGVRKVIGMMSSAMVRGVVLRCDLLVGEVMVRVKVLELFPGGM